MVTKLGTSPRVRIRGKTAQDGSVLALEEAGPSTELPRTCGRKLGEVFESADGEDASAEIEPCPKGRTGEIADGEGWYVLSGLGAVAVGSPDSLKGGARLMRHPSSCGSCRCAHLGTPSRASRVVMTSTTTPARGRRPSMLVNF